MGFEGVGCTRRFFHHFLSVNSSKSQSEPGFSPCYPPRSCVPVIKERRNGAPERRQKWPHLGPLRQNRPIRVGSELTCRSRRVDRVVKTPHRLLCFPSGAGMCRGRNTTHKYFYSTLKGCTSPWRGGWAWPISSAAELRSNEAKPSPLNGEVSDHVILRIFKPLRDDFNFFSPRRQRFFFLIHQFRSINIVRFDVALQRS